MAIITIPDEKRTLEDRQTVTEYLAGIGIEYENWDTSRPVRSDAPAEEILAAYSDEIERLKARGGYVTADVIDVNSQSPGLDAMLAKFNREHWHDEDEVRFIIHGRGVFHIHPREGAVGTLNQQITEYSYVGQDVVATSIERIKVPAGDFSALKVTAQVDIATVMPTWPRFILSVIKPVVPKNTASGVRIVVQSGGVVLSLADVAQLFGAGVEVQAEISGPGLPATFTPMGGFVPMGMMQLGERETLIFEAVVDLHIRDAQPVSSSAVQREIGLDLSSASIRNVLHGLEEIGHLEGDSFQGCPGDMGGGGTPGYADNGPPGVLVPVGSAEPGEGGDQVDPTAVGDRCGQRFHLGGGADDAESIS